MIYASVCSGIECASVAWEPLGWRPSFFAEIDKFPAAVLAHRWPEVPNLGDFTQIREAPHGSVDLLVGGTPCQSFSVAGKRAGLDDPRGNLTLEFLALARRLRPAWVVWENVPGVLSDDEGRTFGTILGILGELGYGWAYRCLDAQYVRTCGFRRAVPQRRRRVFVVGYLGHWTYPAAVLFDRESLSGHPPPRRAAGQDIASPVGNGAGVTGADDNDAQAGRLVAHALTGEGHDASEDGTGRGTPLVPVPILKVNGGTTRGDGPNGAGIGEPGDPMFTLQAGKQHAVAYQCHGSNVGEMGTLRSGNGHATGGVPFVAFNARQDPIHGDVAGPLDRDAHTQAVAFAQNSRDELRLEGGDGSVVGLKTGGGKPGQSYPAVAVNMRGRDGGVAIELGGDVATALRQGADGSDKAHVLADWRVRRLLPVECERLMGLPDDYTRIPWRGRPAAECPDGPRYRAIGNGMAVNVMRWIGRRIEMVARLCPKSPL